MIKIPTIVSHKLECMGLLCAFLVVAIHVPGIYTASNEFSSFVKQFFSNGLCRIAVPFFFITSGYLLGQASKDKGWYFVALKKRCKSLLLPYLIWSLMWTLFSCSMSYISSRFKHAQFDWAESFPSLVNVFGIDFSCWPQMYILWFMRTLMILVIMSPLLVWFAKGKRKSVVVISLTFALLSFSNYLPNGVPKDVSTGLFYFVLGLVFANNNFHAAKSKIWNAGILIFGVVFLACWAVKLYSSICLLHVGILATTLGVYTLCPDCELPKFAHGCSFPIYLIHLFILMPLAMGVSVLTGSHNFDTTLVAYFFYWLVGGVLSFALSWIIRRSAISSIFFGGR